ncbi:hypothetical protein WL40_00035 [Burkholderia ubonensis]|uniref:hypothetical protein n=1 Tax=Burkholderia ubonensis TaxID=101571 RepID=UPI00075C8852|nr:hypothetical protein [Burkholderia ubonensis]KWB76668.1 hypothetical protein WL40_00035 [Burkholderia ubonensis]
MLTTASYTFNSNELWTLGIAAYAAVISTFVLGWDAYKWLRSGPRIMVSASTGMKMVGGSVEDPRTYVTVIALNVGDRPTTITNLGGMYFESWWHAYIGRRKPKQAFIITDPAPAQRIPYRFDVGMQWIGMAEQTEEIEQMARGGYLFLILYTATGGRGKWIRVRAPERANIDEQHE